MKYKISKQFSVYLLIFQKLSNFSPFVASVFEEKKWEKNYFVIFKYISCIYM